MEEPLYSSALQRVAIAACAVLLVLVLPGVGYAIPGQSPPALAATVFALAAGIGGIGWHLACPCQTRVPSWLLLTAAGLAGSVIIGLVPASPGYLIAFTALFAIGMALPPARAFGAGLVVAAAVNLAVLPAGQVSVSNLVGNDVGAAFLFSIGMFTRSNRISNARARAAQARAEQLVTQLRAAQAAQAQAAVLTERTRLAREVHDILAHSLSGLVLALDTADLLGRRGDTGPETQARILEQVVRAQRIARDGLADTRPAIAALRGEELPGPALLDRLVRDTSEVTGLRATLHVTGERRPVSPEAGLALYRTAQEALINSAKHAGRDGRAELRLRYQPDEARLEVEDVRAADTEPVRATDGGALPAGSLTAGGLTFGGYGLAGMRERAELLGGELDAGPTDAGFRVVLRLPDRQSVSPGQPFQHEAEAV
jgi:signal transduction histidine kinase